MEYFVYLKMILKDMKYPNHFKWGGRKIDHLFFMIYLY